LESIVPETNGQQARTSQAKALVFFRSAININPANAVCANDLGVLLFNMGRLQEAENALKASLGSSQSQLVWNNLALVHRQRAATAISAEQRNQQLWLADVATKEAQEYVIDPQNNRIADSQWATASEFQNNAAFPDTVVQHASDPLSENAPSQGTNKPASIMQKVKGWF